MLPKKVSLILSYVCSLPCNVLSKLKKKVYTYFAKGKKGGGGHLKAIDL